MMLLIVAAVAAWIPGRRIVVHKSFALGSNEEAVRLSGINTDS